MRTVPDAATAQGSLQFGLMGLMEFMTICAILFALSAAIGVTSSIFLAMMALALAARRGPFALITFAFASIATDWPFGAPPDVGWLRQLLVILIGISLSTWFRLRRTWHQ